MDLFPTPDISTSPTLHADFYRDPAYFSACREKVFARSWQFLGDASRAKTPGSASPLTILDGFLSEPSLLTRDPEDRVHLLSNVCTHHGRYSPRWETGVHQFHRMLGEALR